MSNCQEVDIRGYMPYCIYDSEAALLVLGLLNCPSYGHKISYGKQFWGPKNQFEGHTTYYYFCITGTEAVWEKKLIEMITSLIQGGAIIIMARCQDIDFPTPWHDLEIPESDKIELTPR